MSAMPAVSAEQAPSAPLVAAWVQAVVSRLQPLADADRAVAMRAYLLDQFPFLGLPAPVRRAAVKDLLQPAADAATLLARAELLWQRPEREYRYTAIDLLRRHSRRLEVSHLPVLQTLLLREAWWESVDGLAAVIGALLHRQPAAQTMMDDWLAHPVFWVRRVAMLHQLGWRQDTDADRLFRYALHLAPEGEFFIRKAIGWALRDYARWQPEAVRAFLREHAASLSPLTRREAGKHLSADGS